jgi:hypothetical protein
MLLKIMDVLFGCSSAKDPEKVLSAPITEEPIVEECYFCKKKVSPFSLEAEEWCPIFYTKGDFERGPVCTDCTRTRLKLAEDGEWEEV